MVTIDLITGFLGSGKTTFLKKYAEYLMDQGLHIGILENDFGAINVDMLMLHELRGDQCELEMIAGGCDAESHRRRFRTKLISMRMCGYDRVLVEPSGIYDVDEFFDVLREDPLDQWYEIGNVITILDARLEDNLSEQADYLLASEAANAGKVILSHADAATREQCEDTVAHLNRALEQIRCDRRIDPKKDILQKNLTDLTKEDLEEVSKCKIFLGHKTHSTIFALATGTPLIALAYHPKTIKFLQQFDMALNAIDDKQLSIQALIQVLDRLNTNLDEISQLEFNRSQEKAKKISSDLMTAINILSR